MKVTRLIDLPAWLNQEEPQKTAFSVKRNGKWEDFSREYYAQISDSVSLGLMSMGIKKGDKIASVTNNRPEWNFVDMGTMQLGAIHVPIYSTISRDEYIYILKHSEAKIIFISDAEIYTKVEEIISSESLNIEIFTFDKVKNAKHWTEVTLEAKDFETDETKLALRTAKEQVMPSDICSIIYTSGTTGNPKGVMLTHNNIVTNFSDDKDLTIFKKGDRAISFLPLCHVLEKSANYLFQYYRVGVYYAENVTTIAENMREIHPTCFVTVPRLLEKIYDRIIATAKNLPLSKKMVFFWALKIGLNFGMFHK